MPITLNPSPLSETASTMMRSGRCRAFVSAAVREISYISACVMLEYMSNSDAPVSEGSLPRSEIGADGICVCPYCGRRFAAVQAPARRTCLRCGHRWESRGPEPKKCPKCGSYSWNVPAERCVCRVCGYEWEPRRQGGPVKCPRCKSERWNIGPPPGVPAEAGIWSDETVDRWIEKRYLRGEGCIDIACETGRPLFKVMSVVRSRFGEDVWRFRSDSGRSGADADH